jgi:hypothetical protein
MQSVIHFYPKILTHLKNDQMLYRGKLLITIRLFLCNNIKRSSFLSIIIFSTSLLYAFEACSQIKPPTFGPSIINYTIFSVWKEVLPGNIPIYSRIITDAHGNMYAWINEVDKKKQLSVLSNGAWKNIHQGLPPGDSMISLDVNLSGDIHAIFRNYPELSCYKLINGNWEIAVKNNGWICVGNDGKYYGEKETSMGMRNIVRWENGNWLPVGPPDNLIVVPKFSRMVVDAKGVLYFGYEEDKNKPCPIKMWDGKAVTEIGQMPTFIGQLELDKHGNLYATTHMSKNWFFKKWNGIEWADIVLPNDISHPDKYTPGIDFCLGTVYLRGHNEKNPSKDFDLFYRYDNNEKWTLLLTYIYSDLIVQPFESNKKVYAVRRSIGTLSSKMPFKVFRQETYPFIFKQGVAVDNGIKRKLSSLRLIKQDGRYGITDNMGDTLLYPAFNEIVIGQLENKETGNKPVYTFRVTTGGETFDCNINYHRDQKYLYSPGKDGSYKKCDNCEGRGIFVVTQKVYIEGEKIPEETTSTTTYKTSYETRWDPKTNTNKGYTTRTPVTTTKTSGGGRKPGHYEEQKINEKCKICRGDGKKYDPHLLEYSVATKTYKKAAK